MMQLALQLTQLLAKPLTLQLVLLLLLLQAQLKYCQTKQLLHQLYGNVEEVHMLSSTVLTAANGSIQYVTLSGNTTFTESIAGGSGILLMINPATHAVTWLSVVWTRGDAPTLVGDKFNTVVLWRVASVLYGAAIGAMG